MPQVSLRDAFDLHQLDLRARRCEQSTLNCHRWYLVPFIAWCNEQGVTFIHELTATHIKTYLVSLQERSLTGYTQRGVASSIRALLNYCVRDEILLQSPFRKIRMPEVDEELLPALTQNEVKCLWRATKAPIERVAMLVLLDSGLRAAEMLALNGGDIDHATGEIRVRKGKGKRGRTTYIGPKALKELRRYYITRGTPGADQPVFTARDGSRRRLSRSGLFKSIQRLARRAGVPNCTCHAFRRTFCLESLRSGMDIFHLARLSGHKNLDVLKRYLDLVKADLRDAQEKHGVVSRLLD